MHRLNFTPTNTHTGSILLYHASVYCVDHVTMQVHYIDHVTICYVISVTHAPAVHDIIV